MGATHQKHHASLTRFLILIRRVLLISGILLLAGCEAERSVMRPKGPAAEEIAEVGWFMFIVATLVFVITMGLLLAALIRRRHHPGNTTDDPLDTNSVILSDVQWGDRFILIAGVIIPLVILVILFFFTLDTMESLALGGDENMDAAEEPLTILVTGHQYWWEIYYPQYDFYTANEIHIPAARPVRVLLTSDDVIHSFWVPELNGKIDLFPARTNTIWIEANAPGEYRGQCAELCGVQHAKMQLLVIAQETDDFEAWLLNQMEPAPSPTSPLITDGMQVFMEAGCITCHRIRGTNADGDQGPDLTHLASRRTIGAGILPNTRGHLAGWIIDSQAIKPGNKMPPMPMTAEDLNLLLAYLETLE